MRVLKSTRRVRRRVEGSCFVVLSDGEDEGRSAKEVEERRRVEKERTTKGRTHRRQIEPPLQDHLFVLLCPAPRLLPLEDPTTALQPVDALLVVPKSSSRSLQLLERPEPSRGDGRRDSCRREGSSEMDWSSRSVDQRDEPFPMRLVEERDGGFRGGDGGEED